MSIDGNALGGRLPLYGSEALDPAQKALYDWLMDVAVPWAEAADFEASTGTGRLIGPFNPALLTPEISSAFFDLAVAEQKHTSLSKRSREVIILTVGAVWQAPYELYAIAPLRGMSVTPTTRCEHLPPAGCRRTSRTKRRLPTVSPAHCRWSIV